MASSASFHFLFLFSFFLFISLSLAKEPTFRPTGLILPVTKHSSTLQYLTHIKQRTPLVSVKLTLDLGGSNLWVDCSENYTTSTYRPGRCNSAQCSLAKSKDCISYFGSPGVGSINNTCGLYGNNPIMQYTVGGSLASDVIAIQSTTKGKIVSVPHFLFGCSYTFLLNGLASGVTGMAGLGRTKIALPLQFAAHFGFKKKFSLCLSSSTDTNGAVFFGDELFTLPSLIYTPLLTNPVSRNSWGEGESSSEYFIGVKSIKINEKVVPINAKLLSINTNLGTGGTKISTSDPYTVLQSSIYSAVIEAFEKELNATRVKSVEPFGACYSSKDISNMYTGPAVPTIDLDLQNPGVYWRIFGGNSMVQVSKDVLCLGVVDGGVDPTTSIVLGGHQIEENMLQFDLASSKLGFSSLLFHKQVCRDFAAAA